MQVQLRRLGPNSKIKILKIPRECRSKMWLAGRGTSCQIYTKSKFASRQHFCITYKEQKFFISDLQSANGTFVNDEKLICERPLAFGSIISVGVPSDMQNSLDCIVYVFEQFSDVVTSSENKDCHCENKKPPTFVETNTHCAGEPVIILENRENMDVDPQLDCPEAEIVNGFVDVEKTVLNDSDVVIIGSPAEEEPRPAKIRKMETVSPPRETEWESNEFKPELTFMKSESKPNVIFMCDESRSKVVCEDSESKDGDDKMPRECPIEDDDLMAYEALTQVDEPQENSKPDLLNYSLTEELIEISDSDDDWSPGPKAPGSGSPEGGDEDDDVMVLETIIRTKDPSKFDGPPIVCKVEDDLTEVDKKWMGKLLKIKSENDLFSKVTEIVNEDIAVDQTEAPSEITEDESRDKAEELIVSCEVRLNRLSTADAEKNATVSSTKTLPRVQVPKTVVKRVAAKKTVSFNLVPEIKYFEAPSRPKLTASEKGRLRFARIIFNICNWNTHWLEECKRVAPDKDPPDICEEQLRKIPKKFPSHSDYMSAFVPVMLLHLWNKVKERWVTSGESGFRQTVSCDSYEDYHTENLHVYKCTGLVQNVDVHKELLREGHLVLLRLHQSQSPQFSNPASQKYSKKLGYLVFGFVESKFYERFHNQTLHELLAERCASIVGDLHIVRLTILVKKRPNFLVDRRKLTQLTVIQRISQEIRMFRGICLLPDSQLCGAILKPTKNKFSLIEPPKKEKIIFKGPLDENQSEIVRKLSHSCSSSNSFLYSIHGAAGTGKGQVIVALILQLLHGDEWKGKKPKILYCTQWSIPLDEIVAKLKVLSQSADEPFSLVRVGPFREIKPELRDLCLSNLAANIRTDKRGWRFDSEIEVLKEADVICTTCVTAGIAKMSIAFEKLLSRDRNRKVICIIDEAMSSPEKDSIIPLLLGVTHLILVGDIYQLEPPFSGEKTHSLGLDMPLFWRMYKNFTGLPKESWPICILKTQYRMNSSLAKLSPLIYNTPLQKPTVSASGRIPSIRTHLLFVEETPEDISKIDKETRELKIVAELVKAVVKMSKVTSKVPLRYGVITCDAKQIESLQTFLPKREYFEVQIIQLQASQGREFEVVVFFYDGRKMLSSWLATALTRAKCTLFVFASSQSIANNSLIRKMSESAEKHNFLKHVRLEMTSEEFEQIILM